MLQQLIEIFNEDKGIGVVYYLIASTLIGSLLIFWIQFAINRIERIRLRSLKTRDLSLPIETDSPVENFQRRTRIIAQSQIETKSQRVKRIVVPLFAILWILMTILPLLDLVPAAYLSFLIGTITVLISIAAKPFVENVIAGFVISFGQPIRLGDTVTIEGQYGTVEELALTYAVIRVWDWKRFVIPNNVLLQKEFTNLTIKDNYIWQKVEYFVAPDTDLDLLEKINQEAFEQSPHFLGSEPPAFWVMRMEKESIVCWGAGWAESPPEAWDLGHDVRMYLCRELNKRGIRLQAFTLILKTKNPKGLRSKANH